MAPRRRVPALFGILSLGAALGAVLPDVPTPENFLRRKWATATVLGNYVYIDGGELSQLVDGEKKGPDVVNSTLSIDISESWKNTDVAIRSIFKAAPRKADAGLWTDSAAGVFYSWGGRWVDGLNKSATALWKFTADGAGGGEWTLDQPGNPTLFNTLHPPEYGAFAHTNDMGFVIGGVSHAWTELDHPLAAPIPGMVTFDMKTKLWQNGTTNFSPYGDGILNQGLAEYMAGFGENGLIITLGGYTPNLIDSLNGPAGNGLPLDLMNLTFFDPQTKKRYTQVTTGTIPPTPRGQACTTVFATEDGGYDIFLAGGVNGRDKYNYQDAYILSLPGFVWTKVPDSPGGPRYGASCVPVGNRQVLSIGGMDKSSSDKDPAPQGLLLFDMTAMEWKDSYDAAAAAYERASNLKTWYSNGSLDTVAWSSDDVRKLFVVANKGTTTGTDSRASSTGNPLPDSSTSTGPESSSSNGTPVGAIAGGVVGGVAGVALIGVVAWLIMRRKKQQQQQVQQQQQQQQQDRPELGSAPYMINGGELPAGQTVQQQPAWKYGAIPEAAATNGYAEMPAREMESGYGPYSEMADSHGKPAELDASGSHMASR